MREFFAQRRSRARKRTVLIAALVVACSGVAAQGAQATVLIQNHTDPAGDPTWFPYHMDLPQGLPPVDFRMQDGDQRAFGPFEGTVVITASPPAGWRVTDIRCVGPDPAKFAYDIANGRVTIQHGRHDENICSFTNGRAPAPTPAPAPPSGPGIAPQPPTSALAGLPAARKAELMAIIPGRRSVTARVNVVRLSVIRTQLIWHHRVVARSRVVRRKGLYDVRVRLHKRLVRALRHQGRKRVTVTLRMVVNPRRRGGTSVFRHRVIIAL